MAGPLQTRADAGVAASVADNDDGIVLDHTVEVGNPPDAPQLAPAVKRVTKRTRRTSAPSPPTAATARNASRTTCTIWACARS